MFTILLGSILDKRIKIVGKTYMGFLTGLLGSIRTSPATFFLHPKSRL